MTQSNILNLHSTVIAVRIGMWAKASWHNKAGTTTAATTTTSAIRAASANTGDDYAAGHESAAAGLPSAGDALRFTAAAVDQTAHTSAYRCAPPESARCRGGKPTSTREQRRDRQLRTGSLREPIARSFPQTQQVQITPTPWTWQGARTREEVKIQDEVQVQI